MSCRSVLALLGLRRKDYPSIPAIALRIMAVRLLNPSRRHASSRASTSAAVMRSGRTFTSAASPGARRSIGPTRMRPFWACLSFHTRYAESEVVHRLELGDGELRQLHLRGRPRHRGGRCRRLRVRLLLAGLEHFADPAHQEGLVGRAGRLADDLGEARLQLGEAQLGEGLEGAAGGAGHVGLLCGGARRRRRTPRRGHRAGLVRGSSRGGGSTRGRSRVGRW